MVSGSIPDPPSLGSGPREAYVDPVIEAYKKDVDRTLVREMLRMTVEQRFDALMALQEFAQELRRAGKAATTAASTGR